MCMSTFWFKDDSHRSQVYMEKQQKGFQFSKLWIENSVRSIQTWQVLKKPKESPGSYFSDTLFKFEKVGRNVAGSRTFKKVLKILLLLSFEENHAEKVFRNSIRINIEENHASKAVKSSWMIKIEEKHAEKVLRSSFRLNFEERHAVNVFKGLILKKNMLQNH